MVSYAERSLEMKRDRSWIRYTLVVIWFLFTVTLTGWWAYFALKQLDALMKLDTEHAVQLLRYQKMIFREGLTLFLCLLGGGITLSYFIYLERKERDRINEFFAAFSHELKTPIAGLRLQAEILMERLKDEGTQKMVSRLLSDIGRLHLRLENSLFLASETKQKLLIESVLLSDLFRSIEGLCPELRVETNRDCVIKGDVRALEIILGNLMKNAATHGKAKNMQVQVAEEGVGKLRISFQDDGIGLQGDRRLLGCLFSRPYSGSGSGIGLYLVSKLASSMGGAMIVQSAEKGFAIDLILLGEML